MSAPSSQASVRDADRTRADAFLGRVISGRYRIDALIAMGGMGAVYAAEHVHMRKRVAIKILHPSAEQRPDLVERFGREAVAGAHIQHPNVAAATDFGELEGGSFFLVLEYVEGRTLTEIIRSGPVPAERAVQIARQLAAALEATHAMGVIHRDVKPLNVMVAEGPRDVVKLIDYGFAKVESDRLSCRLPPAGALLKPKSGRRLTVRGVVFGTLSYMAPEAAGGMDAIGARADLYALGLILYEMLTGKPPFRGEDPVELFAQQCHTAPPRMAERAPGVRVPPELERVVMRLLEKRPQDRYASAAEVIAALDAAGAAHGGPSRRSDSPRVTPPAPPSGPYAPAGVPRAESNACWSATEIDVARVTGTVRAARPLPPRPARRAMPSTPPVTRPSGGLPAAAPPPSRPSPPRPAPASAVPPRPALPPRGAWSPRTTLLSAPAQGTPRVSASTAPSAPPPSPRSAPPRRVPPLPPAPRGLSFRNAAPRRDAAPVSPAAPWRDAALAPIAAVPPPAASGMGPLAAPYPGVPWAPTTSVPPAALDIPLPRIPRHPLRPAIAGAGGLLRSRGWRAASAALAVLGVLAIVIVLAARRETRAIAAAGLFVPRPIVVAAAARPPAAPVVDTAGREALLGTVKAKRWLRAAEALAALAESDPAAFAEPDIAAAARAAALSIGRLGGERADIVFSALAYETGAAGLDVLYELAARRGRSASSDRAASLLRRPEVAARATPALRAALELRAARCAPTPELLDRAAVEGDGRALVALEGAIRVCGLSDAGVTAARDALKARRSPDGAERR